MAAADPGGVLIEGRMTDDRVLAKRHLGLRQGYIDELAFACQIPRSEGAEDADGEVKAAHHVADAHAHAHRWLVLEAVQAQRAAHRLGHDIDGGVPAVRPRLAVAAQRGVDEGGVHLA